MCLFWMAFWGLCLWCWCDQHRVPCVQLRMSSALGTGSSVCLLRTPWPSLVRT